MDAEHFPPLPRNNARAESLSSISEGQDYNAARVIGFAGELRENKGRRPRLSAYAQIKQKSAATLLIVSHIRAGTDRQIFEEFRQLYTRARIIATGSVSPRDLPIYYSWMDVFVQPSRRERDTVMDCKNWRLVSTSNEYELAQTVSKLLNDEDLRTRTRRQPVRQYNFTMHGESDGDPAVYQSPGLQI